MKYIFFALVLLFSTSIAQARTCTPADAEAADAAVDHLDTWAAVDKNYRKFGHCDDGSIAEGNSEAVARLLVDKWQTLPELAVLIKRHPSLKRYVLRHIDTTLDTNDLNKIVTLATTSCSVKYEHLCVDIKAAAIRSLKQ